MSDVHSPEIRSKNMSAIKGKNTSPELIVRKALFKQGFRYRVHNKNLPGKPDIVLKKYKTVIFVHGCFWHGHNCRFFKWPKTRKPFWKRKITGNMQRDKSNINSLVDEGWKCIIIWECSIPKLNSFKIQSFISTLATLIKADKATYQVSEDGYVAEEPAPD